MYPKISIVIVGGGFAGVACAKECARLFAHRPDITLTLVSPRPYHDYHGVLYEMATAVGAQNDNIQRTLTYEQVCLRKAVCLPLLDIFKGTRVQLLHGTVHSLDRAQRMLSITHAPRQHYTYVVLALGSMAAMDAIPGLREHSFTLKTIDDALQIRRALLHAIRHKVSLSRNDITPTPLRIVVGGGGFTGTELSAELVGMMQAVRRTIPNASLPCEIMLLSGKTGPLSALGDRTSMIAMRRLQQYGVRIRAGNRVMRIERERHEDEAVRPSTTIVTLDNGERVKTDVFIWTGGVVAAKLYHQLFPHYIGDNGRLTIDPTLRVVGEDRIFAIGDGAYLTTDSYPRGLPQQASIAVAQGKAAAGNIARAIAGKPLTAFSCPRFSYCVPLGGKYAIALLSGGRILHGFIAWCLKQWLECKYYCSVLGIGKGIRTWMSMERICFRND